MKKSLPFYHVFQKLNDNNCGLACLEMIYKIKGTKRNIKDIQRNFYINDKKGEDTYIPQLAIDLLENKIKTKIILYNSFVIPPIWKNLKKSEIIEKLKIWLTRQCASEWHLFGLFLLFYLQKGGDIEVKPITTNLLKSLTNKKSLILTSLEGVMLRDSRVVVFDEKKYQIDNFNGINGGHMVLIDQEKNKKFHILDPSPTKINGKLGSYWIDEDVLVNSIIFWSGTLVEISNL